MKTVNLLSMIIASLLLASCGGDDAMNFTCGDQLEYNAYSYSTVQIEGQCWFAENLRTSTYLNGDLIPPNKKGFIYGFSDLVDYGCRIPDDFGATGPAEIHGELYNGYAVIDDRKICPIGWHVPTDIEWATMDINVGLPEDEAFESSYGFVTGHALELKSTPLDPIPYDGNNSSGFSITPGQCAIDMADFGQNQDETAFWQSTLSDNELYFRYFRPEDFGWIYHSTIGRLTGSMNSGCYVRCIKD